MAVGYARKVPKKSKWHTDGHVSVLEDVVQGDGLHTGLFVILVVVAQVLGFHVTEDELQTGDLEGVSQVEDFHVVEGVDLEGLSQVVDFHVVEGVDFEGLSQVEDFHVVEGVDLEGLSQVVDFHVVEGVDFDELSQVDDFQVFEVVGETQTDEEVVFLVLLQLDDVDVVHDVDVEEL